MSKLTRINTRMTWDTKRAYKDLYERLSECSWKSLVYVCIREIEVMWRFRSKHGAHGWRKSTSLVLGQEIKQILVCEFSDRKTGWLQSAFLLYTSIAKPPIGH